MIAKLHDVGKDYQKLLRQFGAHEPDWKPLEKVMPKLKWCAGFMFMGYSGKVRLYKHGLTRHYLNVDPEGNTYAYVSETDSYVRIPKRVAIEAVFQGLTEMGFKRSTPYDGKARAKRHKLLADAGWTIVTMGPDDVEQTGP